MLTEIYWPKKVKVPLKLSRHTTFEVSGLVWLNSIIYMVILASQNFQRKVDKRPRQHIISETTTGTENGQHREKREFEVVCQSLKYLRSYIFTHYMDLPGGSDGKESACNVGDPGSIPGSRSPGERHGYLLQYSGLENSMNRSLACYSPWGCTVHGVQQRKKESEAEWQLLKYLRSYIFTYYIV